MLDDYILQWLDDEREARRLNGLGYALLMLAAFTFGVGVGAMLFIK
jgi:hypothetical protein